MPAGGEFWILPGGSDGLRLAIGDVADREQLTRSVMPSGQRSINISRSIAADRCAVVASPIGRIGVDIETMERVALNATSRDDWLAASERSIVERATDPTLELGCRWVLKEAYGKALGVGLALPLHRLAFGRRRGRISLESDGLPVREGWSFRLYRYEMLIVALAHQPRRQSATPFAPVGRKPPIPLLDR